MMMNLNRILPFLLTTAQGSRLGLATAGLFSILAFFSLITLLNGWWLDAKLSSLTVMENSVLQEVSSLQDLIYSIPPAHLFGYLSPNAAYIPITSSQLHLTGIIQLGSDEEENYFSKAIISMQGGIGKIFQIGDVLSEGIKITGIQADAVILDHNGHSERLPLQRTHLGIN